MPADMQTHAQEDRPLDIGHGQTNSQPSTVRHMLEWLDVRPSQRVLDVGSGSGWTGSILANLVGPDGWVVATETVPQLVVFGRENCQKLSIKNIEFHRAGEILGYPDEAPYDRILVSAAAAELPGELVDQLATGGRLVIPVMNSILVVDKMDGGELGIIEHPGYVFVPLV